MSKESERIREEIAQRFCLNCQNPHDACLMGKYLCTGVLEEADQILKIKGIAVLSDDQNPPPSICNSMTISRNIDWAEIYCKAQTDMFDAGFRKVV